MKFSQTLKKLREHFGISQRELANKINKKASTISGYEQGNREPDYETLRFIKKVFDCGYELLLEDNPDDLEHIKKLQPQKIDLMKMLDQKDVYVDGVRLNEEDKKDLKMLIKRFK